MKTYKRTKPISIIFYVFMGLTILGFTKTQPNKSQLSAELISNLYALTPTCVDQSNIADEDYSWTYFPASPNQLNTYIDYRFLAGQLIKSGVVDALDCPLGGVWPSGYANACGLEKSQPQIYYLQNVYDDEILNAGYELGVPPVMLKQLIRYESQFWPTIYNLNHYGLSHLTFIGAVTAIQWNPVLYEQMCLLTNNGPCPQSYINYNPATDFTLSGQLISLFDASCQDCEYKIDIQKAEKSIDYIAQSLLGYCRQTSQIVFNVTENMSNYSVDYGTIWKLTLMNYNSGPACVFDAFNKAYEFTQGPVSWEHISDNVSGENCLRGLYYANQITNDPYEFTP